MTNERMISDSKRAAKRMARNVADTYQECLDSVARQAGRKNWGAYLSDPVDVRSVRATDEDASVAVASGEAMIVNDPLPQIRDPYDPAKLRIGSGQGIIIGERSDGVLLRSSRRSIVMCVGAPGTRKTTGVVLPTIATSPDASMLIHDTKPELMAAAITFGSRSHTRMVALDPMDVGVPREVETIGFNPMHPRFRLPGESATEHAQRIVTILMDTAEEPDDLVTEATGGLIGLMAIAMECPRAFGLDEASGPCTIPTIADLFRKDFSRSTLWDVARIAVESSCIEDPSDPLADLMFLTQADDASLADMVDVIRTALLPFLTTSVRKRFSPKDPADGAALLDAFEDESRPTTAFVVNPATLQNGSRLASLAIDCIGRWRATRGPSHRSLQIIIDEACRLRPIPWVRQIMRSGAPHGTALLIMEHLTPLDRSPHSWIGDRAVDLRIDHLIEFGESHERIDLFSKRNGRADATGDQQPLRDFTQRTSGLEGIEILRTPVLYGRRR